MDRLPRSFASWRSYWDFAASVGREMRFVRNEATETFLEAVLDSSVPRRVTLHAGQRFWRAQLGHGWRPEGEGDAMEDYPCAYGVDRMKPRTDRASDGRANPKGIPCLYVATLRDTAMLEVRPWVGSYVSVAQLELIRDVEIIDCSRTHRANPIFFEEPDEAERTKAVWSHIDRAFSEPMTRSDDGPDYAPTQIIAEVFKRAGYGGIAYKSAFGEDGFNVALFDITVGEILMCGLHRVKSIEATITEADNPYHVRKAP